jgi:hypothetical protein
MNLQNGYKVVYEQAAGGKRTFYASKSGFFADAEKLGEFEIGEYKLIYEKSGKFYGSTTGIPSDTDHCFTEFDKVFVADSATENAAEETEDPGKVESQADETGNDDKGQEPDQNQEPVTPDVEE